MPKAALDPGVGKSEVRTMEREIHRMRIRLEGLKREQVWCIALLIFVRSRAMKCFGRGEERPRECDQFVVGLGSNSQLPKLLCVRCTISKQRLRLF